MKIANNIKNIKILLVFIIYLSFFYLLVDNNFFDIFKPIIDIEESNFSFFLISLFLLLFFRYIFEKTLYKNL